MNRSLSLFVQLACLLLVVTPAHAQTYTVLHTFTGKGDGKGPDARLVQGSDGALYGTTYGGGSFDMGSVFKLHHSGNEAVVHSFWGGDGYAPGDSISDQEGVLYGVTWYGGMPEGGEWDYGNGSVFKLDKTGKYTILHRFNGKSDGAAPEGPLLRDAKGNLYGITSFGGDLRCGSDLQGCGVIFKLDTTGKETVIHTFKSSDGLEYPGPIIRDKAGNFYGVAVPTNQAGLIFKLDSSDKVTVLYTFTGGTDGYNPIGPLLRDAAGNLYGVTSSGGNSRYSCGVLFKLDPTGKETVLHQFYQQAGDGCGPGSMIRDTAGNFYGTTGRGGSNGGYGTVFKMDPSGNETVLYSFAGGSNGAVPWALFLDKAGDFYGTASAGGDTSCNARDYVPGCGVVFKLTP